MPYISASIVVQLMGIAVPYLQKLQKDGESGRKKITQITRWLTIAYYLVQAPTYITAIKTQFGLGPEAFLVRGQFSGYHQYYFNCRNNFCNVVR